MNQKSQIKETERLPAVVFACLLAGELRLLIFPGTGLADGGIHIDVPISLVPKALRIPNTKLWVKFDESRQVIGVSKRYSDSQSDS